MTSCEPKVQNTIRIRTSQVDNLLNVISEVVIAQIKDEQRMSDLKAAQSSADESWKAWQRIRSMLTTVGGDAIIEALGDDLSILDTLLAERRRDSSAFAKGYAEDVSRSSVIVNDLQEQGMRLRMLPANTIFQAFPLAVRDLAKQFRKDINLVIEGGDTELDKKVLEEINDPLVHIMRNAVDHGIEDPATRLALGKPAEGTIVLSARPEGDRIVIEVSDDGAGIDPDRVRESAVRKGYITEVEAKVMSDREAQYMIFEAGFSTASIITEISGRGVGHGRGARVRGGEAQGLARPGLAGGPRHRLQAHDPADARDHPCAHAPCRRSGLRASDGFDRRDASRRSERDHQGRGPRRHPSAAADDPARAALRHPGRGRRADVAQSVRSRRSATRATGWASSWTRSSASSRS